MADMISIIIPTLDEEKNITSLLVDLGKQTHPYEVIVSDGGSQDRTVAFAEKFGARIVSGAAGRGGQLRRAAAIARGDILFFLHADSKLDPKSLTAIRSALATQPDLVGGNFDLIFESDDGFSRWLTNFYRWFRSKGLYYGDSGIFVRRTAYDKIGGIPDWPLMEDYRFTRLMEDTGPTICLQSPPLRTSSRRFRGRHPVSIFCGWCWIHMLYYLNVSPAYMARRYYKRRQSWWRA